MRNYPEAVEKIVQDYLQRVSIQLRRFPQLRPGGGTQGTRFPHL